MNQLFHALIAPLATTVVLSLVGLLLVACAGVRREPSRSLKIAFFVLAGIGLAAATWGTFFFQYQPSANLLVKGAPFPVRTFMRWGDGWKEIAYVQNRIFAAILNIFVTVAATAAPASISMAVHLFLRLRSRQRIRRGHCPRCNFDLRFSHERCPECGTVLSRESGAPVPKE